MRRSGTTVPSSSNVHPVTLQPTTEYTGQPLSALGSRASICCVGRRPLLRLCPLSEHDLSRQYFIFVRSSITPGPVGSQPSVLRVHSLEAGISSPAKCANQSKCSAA